MSEQEEIHKLIQERCKKIELILDDFFEKEQERHESKMKENNLLMFLFLMALLIAVSSLVGSFFIE